VPPPLIPSMVSYGRAAGSRRKRGPRRIPVKSSVSKEQHGIPTLDLCALPHLIVAHGSVYQWRLPELLAIDEPHRERRAELERVHSAEAGMAPALDNLLEAQIPDCDVAPARAHCKPCLRKWRECTGVRGKGLNDTYTSRQYLVGAEYHRREEAEVRCDLEHPRLLV
jgi:hypothetical protein